MSDVKTEGDRRLVVGPRGGSGVYADAQQAALMRQGKRERQELKREAAQREARQALARMAQELPPDKVQAYAAKKGAVWLAVWGQIVQTQAGMALKGGKGSTAAARYVGEAAGIMGREPVKAEPAVSLPTGGEELTELLTAFRAWKQNRAVQPGQAAHEGE